VPADPQSILTFVPAKDFDVSCRFYEALGFQAGDDDSDVRLYRRGGAGFLLQNFYVKKWANNFMMAMHVPDLDDWWAAVQEVIDSGEFAGVRAKAPKLEDWGMRVMYLWDPSGVLWHVTGSPEG
jgi:uncharacterized glyoxalase superfamily protein PhnB